MGDARCSNSAVSCAVFSAVRGRQLPGKDGLTGGDGALLELLDLKMLKAEAKGADVAAGRIGARDRARRLLEAAVVWRELARRTGSAEALRKAAANAERAADAYAGAHRQQGWSRARLEQASCALLGAELFGDGGLEAAAEKAAVEAQRAGGAAGMLALVGAGADPAPAAPSPAAARQMRGPRPGCSTIRSPCWRAPDAATRT